MGRFANFNTLTLFNRGVPWGAPFASEGLLRTASQHQQAHLTGKGMAEHEAMADFQVPCDAAHAPGRQQGGGRGLQLCVHTAVMVCVHTHTLL
jgi:hypothetical protein